MIPRYTRPEMAALWTDEFRWQTILDVELLAAEAYARTPEDRRAVKTLRRRAKVDVARILEIEKTTKHDLIAFLTQIEEKAGPAAKVLHRGLTSSDVLDTALASSAVASSEGGSSTQKNMPPTGTFQRQPRGRCASSAVRMASLPTAVLSVPSPFTSKASDPTAVLSPEAVNCNAR